MSKACAAHAVGWGRRDEPDTSAGGVRALQAGRRTRDGRRATKWRQRAAKDAKRARSSAAQGALQALQARRRLPAAP